MNKKVALITDTHIGLRNSSPYFLNKQKQFFEEIFFPTIDQEEIDTVIHLGDVFDKQTNIKFTVFDEATKFFFDEIAKRKLDFHIIVGNHDCPYRNTNTPNAPELLLKRGYDFHVYDGPTEVNIKGNNFCFIPWVNVENTVATNQLIEKTNANYLFGHLEIIGFTMVKGSVSEKGFDRKSLSKFEKVFSGHFHHRSQENNIWYLGNPYETTWADFENQKGFHIFDLDDYSLRRIDNPYHSHVYITKFEQVIEDNLANQIVKIDLTDMTDEEVDKTYKALDNFQKKPESVLFINKANFTEFADADTDDLAITTTKDIMVDYIKSMEDENRKMDELVEYMKELYERALEVE
jgi:DNA repair exonuclease SbcCD nuclease subunit